MRKERKESDVMAAYLKKQSCPDCKGELKLTGCCNYTDPASWPFECTKCQLRGHVGYTHSSIKVIDIPKSKMKAFERLREECAEKVKAVQQKYDAKLRTFYKRHGVVRPRNNEIKIEFPLRCYEK